MPSLRNIVNLTFLSLALVHATPTVKREATPTCLTLPSDVVFPSTLPLVAGPSSLPTPPSNLTLRHVTIGHGIQNYTCSGNLTAPPTAIGAIATIYDVTALSFLSASTSSQIPAIAAFQPLTNSLIPNSPLFVPGLGSFQVLGYHFFDAKGTPNFVLEAVGERLASRRSAGIKAPTNASKGPKGTGAVDWLYLTSTGDAGSVGLGAVYRVDTAGGSPPKSCMGRRPGDVISIPYSAGYHFNG